MNENLRKWLEELTPMEEIGLQQWLEERQATRVKERKEKYWADVVTAIQKYCDECCDNIEIRGGDDDAVICVDQLDEPGVVYTGYLG